MVTENNIYNDNIRLQIAKTINITFWFFKLNFSSPEDTSSEQDDYNDVLLAEIKF